MTDTATGITVVKSPLGSGSVKRSMNIAIPVFCTPVSTAMANTSSHGWRNAHAVKNPPKYPNQGSPKPATAIWNQNFGLFNVSFI